MLMIELIREIIDLYDGELMSFDEACEDIKRIVERESK